MLKTPIYFLLFFYLMLSAKITHAQTGSPSMDIDNDELGIGTDIFSDYSEDIEEGQIAEDERFYRFGRFYSVALGVGLTEFTGNRGAAYENQRPSYTFGVNYFLDFRSSIGMGFGYSKHQMDITGPTEGFAPNDNSGYGLINVNIFRANINYRYYVDTSDLGTALTFANPYFTTRLEYWYVNNKFVDQNLPDFSGGGVGAGLGFGLEFPIKIKESYLGLEALVHTVALHDKDTRRFMPTENSPNKSGYEDLRGSAFTINLSYVWNW